MSSVNADTDLNAKRIVDALSGLEKSGVDKYVIAFGPEEKQFLATPNGYHATHLPDSVLIELLGPGVKKVLWASFGDSPESWCFVYEYKNGMKRFVEGLGVPQPLRQFIAEARKSPDLSKSLRAQLGSDASFVVWSKTAWACSNVPAELLRLLCRHSSKTREHNGVTKGSIQDVTITNVQWHRDGTYYLRTSHADNWSYKSSTVREAWMKLWQETRVDSTKQGQLGELAYVAINPHAPSSETFAFIQKQKAGKESPFILHFGDEPVHSRLVQDDSDLQKVEPKLHETHVQWAISTKKGRPHKDTWELDLEKGEKVKVMRDMGRDWFIVMNRKGVKGWVHRTWLVFSNLQVRKESKHAWARFSADMEKLSQTRQLRDFPAMSQYVNVCKKAECKEMKGDSLSLGICAHDLKALLEDAGNYSSDWIKGVRNQWHPDRFARYCLPEHVDRVRSKAQQLFVLCGVLMESV